VVVAVIAALYFGREVFVPVALAILLSFALTPMVMWLQRRGAPKVLAVIASVAIAFAFIAIFAYVVATQVTALAGSLPNYQGNIERKIAALTTSSPSGGVFGRLSSFYERMSSEVARHGEAAGSAGSSTADPIAVRVDEGGGPFGVVVSVLSPLVKPVTTAGIVIVLVIFILLQRQDLRDRFIRLVGAGNLSRPTQALEDAGSRVSRYLLMQLVVNVTYGIPIGLGLWLIGVPNPWLWGILATVLRFIPYVGPIVSAALPIGLSIAVDSGWTMFAWTVALFVLVELISNNLVEPWLYGSRTGLSAFAIILAAIFWTWLWGPIGLLLSTPLTVCLVVLGRHVPLFGFLDVLLGSEPVLTPSQRLTQRLIAGDSDEATEVAEAYLQDHSIASFYEIAVPALVSIERDRAAGTIDQGRRKLAAEALQTVMENLDEERGQTAEEETTDVEAVTGRITGDWRERKVLCVGGKGSLDDAASEMLARLLTLHGLSARSASLAELSADDPRAIEAEGGLICLSYLDDDSATRARYLIRRLRRRSLTMPILVGLWANGLSDEEKLALAKQTGADRIESSMASAVAYAVSLATDDTRTLSVA
jgi:predicted PurR-regulated permease PerM